MEIKEGETKCKKVVEGRFSQELYMSKDKVAEFLRNLADEIESGNEIKISTDEWELPFTFADQIEIDIEHEVDELEIELEFDKAVGKGGGLSVE